MDDLTSWATRRLAERSGLVPVQVDVTFSSGKKGKAIRYKTAAQAKKLVAEGKAEPVGGAKTTGASAPATPAAGGTHAAAAHDPRAARLASMSKDDFRKEVEDNGLEVTAFRGTTATSDPGPQWYATRRETAEGYARDGGTVKEAEVKMTNPKIMSSVEMINATGGTVKRLQAEGYDGAVAQWSGGVQLPGRPAPAKELYMLKFPPAEHAASEDAKTTGEYPKAGATVDGREVSDAPASNQSSIAASLDDYTVLPGTREVAMQDFGTKKLSDLFYAASDHKHSENLAAAIKAGKPVEPLIVVVDSKGPYILEGAHRFGAMLLLGAKSFPAMVVRDNAPST